MIVSAAVLSLLLVVEGLMGIPVAGSIAVFAVGAGVYLFSVTSLGILLATFAMTMPQFGLLAIPVFVVLYLLSGGVTPVEAMPEPLRSLMQVSPATRFTSFAQAVPYRDAGLALVWTDLAAVAARLRVPRPCAAALSQDDGRRAPRPARARAPNPAPRYGGFGSPVECLD